MTNRKGPKAPPMSKSSHDEIVEEVKRRQREDIRPITVEGDAEAIPNGLWVAVRNNPSSSWGMLLNDKEARELMLQLAVFLKEEYPFSQGEIQYGLQYAEDERVRRVGSLERAERLKGSPTQHPDDKIMVRQFFEAFTTKWAEYVPEETV